MFKLCHLFPAGFHLGILIGCALSVISCAQQKPNAEQSTIKEGLVQPHSKPVRMPPRLKIKGKSSGVALDDFVALQQAGEVLIYDVRVPYFYGIDHIPGAINWPYNKYEAQVQERDIEIQKALNAGKKVVLYCFSIGCSEARNIAKKLARRDYEVHVLTMGIDSWRDAGLPVEKLSTGNSD